MVSDRSASGPEEKEEKLLAATLALVAEYGFHGTSTDMVAKKAGVSPGTLSHQGRSA